MRYAFALAAAIIVNVCFLTGCASFNPYHRSSCTQDEWLVRTDCQ